MQKVYLIFLLVITIFFIGCFRNSLQGELLEKKIVDYGDNNIIKIDTIKAIVKKSYHLSTKDPDTTYSIDCGDLMFRSMINDKGNEWVYFTYKGDGIEMIRDTTDFNVITYRGVKRGFTEGLIIGLDDSIVNEVIFFDPDTHYTNYKGYYSNGILREKGETFLGGVDLKKGEWRYYTNEGTLKEVKNYNLITTENGKESLLDGLAKYYEDGKLVKTETYSSGEIIESTIVE